MFFSNLLISGLAPLSPPIYPRLARSTACSSIATEALRTSLSLTAGIPCTEAVAARGRERRSPRTRYKFFSSSSSTKILFVKNSAASFTPVISCKHKIYTYIMHAALAGETANRGDPAKRTEEFPADRPLVDFTSNPSATGIPIRAE